MRTVEVSEGPKEINDHNVIYWSKSARMLEGDQIKKAHLLLLHDCIKYVGHDQELGKLSFIVLPLNKERFWHEMINGEDIVFEKKPFTHDYNKSGYKIFKGVDGRFVCNCQGWTTKEKKGEGKEGGNNCSHVLALFFSFECGRFGVARSPNEVA